MPKRTRKRKYTPKASYKDPNTDATTSATGLLVDEEGVPYPDQAMQGRRKCSVRRRSPEQRRLIRQRISEVRRMLSIGIGHGDIKRECAQRWGMKERSVEKYYSVARKWNLEILNSTPQEARSDSWNWWTTEIRELQRDVLEGRRIMAEGRQMIDECKRILADQDASPEARINALMLMDRGGKIEARGRRIVDSARGHAANIRRHFDRLTGVDAPLRVSLVGDDGKSVLPSAEQRLEGAALDLEIKRLAAITGLLPSPDAPVESFPLVPDETKGAPIETTGNVRHHTTIDRHTPVGGACERGHLVEHLPPQARKNKAKNGNGRRNGNSHAPPEVFTPK